MAIQTCRWTSDTCGDAVNGNCIVEFDVDSTINGSAFNFRRVRTCNFHSVLSGTEDQIIQNIRAENARGSSNVVWQILQNAPTSMVDISAVDGSRTFKSGITISWNWTGIAPNRVLNILVTGASLTTTQKNSIQTKLDSLFGVGNVLVTYG